MNATSSLFVREDRWCMSICVSVCVSAKGGQYIKTYIFKFKKKKTRMSNK